MPKLLQETEIKLRWEDIQGRQKKDKVSPETRQAGVHLSGIIKYCLYSDRKEHDPDEFPLSMAVGMAWEDWSVGLYKSALWQPGPETLDGVTGTCDGLSSLLINGEYEIVVEEWKATWKSRHTHQDILKETAWLWQIGALAHMHGIRHARLHVLWINNDYRPPQPKYITYLIEFQTNELELFWRNCILKNKDKAVPEEGS